MAKKDWRNRDQWLGSLGIQSDRVRRQSLESLSQCQWHQLHDLENLFAQAGARASRRQRRGESEQGNDFREMHASPRLDVFIPFGLGEFSASLDERPRTFEQLCRELWELDRTDCKDASMPGWFHSTCASSLVAKPEHLQQWWWANIMGAAASAVRQLKNRVVESEHPTSAKAVTGLSFRNYKTLSLNPHERADHASSIDACALGNIKLGLVDLGTGQKVLVRGVSTGGYVPRVSAESDESVYDYFADQAQRLVEISWTLVVNGTIGEHQATQVESSIRRMQKSLHYITKLDSTRRSYLFEEEVVVTFPTGMRFDIYVVFGPWAGHGKLFSNSQTILASPPPQPRR